MTITLKKDNGNVIFVPILTWTVSQAPILDALIRVTLGIKAHSGTITAASNADPIVIPAPAHGLETDDWIVVCRVNGNKGANGVWKITKIDANSFSLQDAEATGDYLSDGKWFKALIGATDLEMVADGKGGYAAIVDKSVDLEQPEQYMAVAEASNYQWHTEVDTLVEYRTT